MGNKKFRSNQTFISLPRYKTRRSTCSGNAIQHAAAASARTTLQCERQILRGGRGKEQPSCLRANTRMNRFPPAREESYSLQDAKGLLVMGFLTLGFAGFAAGSQ